jgi:hypothetical protein
MANTVLGEKLNEAITKKANDIENFIWKGPKMDVDGQRSQATIRMVDGTPEQLKDWYKHCQSMLYSNDKKFPGRYVLRDIVEEQRMKCNVELYLRWLENKFQTDYPNVRKPYPRFLYLQDIRSILRENEETLPKSDYAVTPISVITNGIPVEFRDVSIASVIDGCLDQLGVMDKSHISLKFITKLGVWFTDKEMNELLEKDANGNIRNRIDVIKERHNLKSVIKLRPNFKGLHYSELRAMLNLKPIKKYSELTTDQLVTLRDKVLFRFEEEIEFHISQWKEIIKQLELVANSKGFSLIENEKSN